MVIRRAGRRTRAESARDAVSATVPRCIEVAHQRAVSVVERGQHQEGAQKVKRMRSGRRRKRRRNRRNRKEEGDKEKNRQDKKKDEEEKVRRRERDKRSTYSSSFCLLVSSSDIVEAKSVAQ
jgi:hypothetical protein